MVMLSRILDTKMSCGRRQLHNQAVDPDLVAIHFQAALQALFATRVCRIVAASFRP